MSTVNQFHLMLIILLESCTILNYIECLFSKGLFHKFTSVVIKSVKFNIFSRTSNRNGVGNCTVKLWYFVINIATSCLSVL